jgi:superfamily II DNA or RNA helicase
MVSADESSILRLDKLTPHQAQKLEECRDALHVHLQAPAGGGKSFLGCNRLLELIRGENFVLYVAPNQALALTFRDDNRT